MENTTTIATLRESIEAIAAEDFTAQGTTTAIYLDPEKQNVYTFLDTGAIPMTAYHNIDQLVLRVRPGAIASSVYNELLVIEDRLAAILGQYQGTVWNGSNHIGKWSQDGLDQMEALDEYQGQRVNEIAYYWDAGDWFSPVSDTLKASWQEGQTAEQIIDGQGCGSEQDGMCDRDAAIAWLKEKIGEWEAEKAASLTFYMAVIDIVESSGDERDGYRLFSVPIGGDADLTAAAVAYDFFDGVSEWEEDGRWVFPGDLSAACNKIHAVPPEAVEFLLRVFGDATPSDEIVATVRQLQGDEE